MKRSILTLASAATIAVGATTYAGGHADVPGEIVARHGLMQVMAMNMGVVGGMARGNVDYDAAAAQEAADNLAAVGMIKQTMLWPEGTAAGENENSRALPAIWSDRAGFDTAWSNYGEATMALQAVASDGLEALQGGVGGVGRTCGGCHDTYRQPSE